MIVLLCLAGGVVSGCGAVRQEQLLQALDQGVSPIQIRAAAEVSQYVKAQPAVRQALVERLCRETEPLAADLTRSLAAAGAEVVPDVLRAWDDQKVSDQCRMRLMWVLGRVGPPAKAAMPSLCRMLSAEGVSPEMCAVIRVTLANLGDTSRENLSAISKAVSTGGRAGAVALEAMAFGGGAGWADDALIVCLVRLAQEQDGPEQAHAVLLLGRLGEKAGPEAAAVLSKALEAALKEHGAGSALVLGCALARIDRSHAIAHLERVLGRAGAGPPDEGAMVQMVWIRAVLADAQFARELIALSNSKQTQVVKGAVWAIAGCLGPDALEAGQRLLDILAHDKDEGLRAMAAQALGSVLPDTQVERLEALRGKEPSEDVKQATTKGIFVIRLGQGAREAGRAGFTFTGTDAKMLQALGDEIEGMPKKRLDDELRFAAREGFLQSVRFLLDHGADVNAQGQRQRTPLHWAAFGGHPAVVKLLVARGAQIESRNDTGCTTLYEAVCCLGANKSGDYVGVVRVLIGAGADPNTRAFALMFSATPLLCATSSLGEQPKEALSIMNLLLEHGADPNAQSDDGDTPLLDAVRYGSKDAVETLLARGANVNIKNKSGETPLALARKLRKASIAELLRKHGAKE